MDFLEVGDLPLFNPDLFPGGVFPDEAKRICESIKGHSFFLISTPEYNGSIPSFLANIFEWASVYCKGSGSSEMALKGKTFAIMGVSHSGDSNALEQLSRVIRMLGGTVLNPQIAVKKSSSFNKDGHFIDSEKRKAIEELLLVKTKASCQAS